MRIIKDDTIRINMELCRFSWLDMSLNSFDWPNLTIQGSVSESYPYDIELYFSNVNHISARDSWKTDTSKCVIREIVDREFNTMNQIEIGHKTFEIIAEGTPNPMRITAKSIELRISKEQTE